MSDGVNSPIGLHIQRNHNRMEILCAKCDCMGELDATMFDINYPDVWRDVAKCFSAFGWSCKDGRCLCCRCAGFP